MMFIDPRFTGDKGRQLAIAFFSPLDTCLDTALMPTGNGGCIVYIVHFTLVHTKRIHVSIFQLPLSLPSSMKIIFLCICNNSLASQLGTTALPTCEGCM